MDVKGPRLYNTLHRRVEPVVGTGRLGWYGCGPTVYGPAHVGNFRTYVVQDVFLRLLKVRGNEVTYVRNVTDVDDKTIRGSRTQGLSLKSFTDKWYARFRTDSKKLNLLSPTVEPKATE
ncbi:MAG: class I tRNA ligase family protein, partial [Puniceicoccales bacterium]|nr:class I tRNA ligase family protein [Puniceicoccales bacterium]